MKLVAVLAVSVSMLVAQTEEHPLRLVTAVRHWSVGDATRVAIEISGSFELRSDRLHNPERIYYDILRARPSIQSKRIYSEVLDDKLVKRVRVAETQPGITRVVLDLGADVEATTSTLANPNRLIVELRNTGTSPPAPAEQPTASTSAPPASQPVSSARRERPGADSSAPRSSPPESVARQEHLAGGTNTRPGVSSTTERSPTAKSAAPRERAAAAVTTPASPAPVPTARGQRPGSGSDTPQSPPRESVTRQEVPAAVHGDGPSAAEQSGAAAAAPSSTAPAPTAAHLPESSARPEPAGASVQPPPSPQVALIRRGPLATAAAPLPPMPSAAPQPESPKMAASLPVGTSATPLLKAAAPEAVSAEPSKAQLAKAEVPEASLQPKPTVPAAPDEIGKAARHTSSGETSLVRALGLKVGRVVIDPGHGGHDQGTEGPHGLLEKDLVLDIALRLGKLIETRMGAEVIYTRSDDTFIPLEGRTALANEKKADLFLSIHANSSSIPRIAGVETYYLNIKGSSQDALDVASRENASSQKSIFELADIIQKIARHDKAEESKEFASRIQGALYPFSAHSVPGSRNRGVRTAPFVVLIGANMPSVLAEIGFLSNPREEALLKKPDYRQKLAEAMFRGVTRYGESLSHFQVAAAKE
jgi:N-acetylmuramoyl-L-alanine amidase